MSCGAKCGMGRVEDEERVERTEQYEIFRKKVERDEIPWWFYG